MKKLLMLLACTMVSGILHSYAVVPLLMESRKWVYYELIRVDNSGQKGWTPAIYELNGDTVVNNVTYHKLYKDYYHHNGLELRHYYALAALVREEIKNNRATVYARKSPMYQWPLLGAISGEEVPGWGYEYRVYVFLSNSLNWFESVPLSVYDRTHYFTFTDKTEIEINGTVRACYNTDDPCRKMIEGVGYIDANVGGKPFANFIHMNPIHKNWFWAFSHLIEDGEIVYKGENYDYLIENDYIKNMNQSSGVEDIEEVRLTDDGIYYDMQGRRVAAPTQPGIYIHNGNKVVIK